MSYPQSLVECAAGQRVLTRTLQSLDRYYRRILSERMTRLPTLKEAVSLGLRRGPGLLVMLADCDAGNVVAAAQVGAQTGLRLLPVLLALVPRPCCNRA